MNNALLLHLTEQRNGQKIMVLTNAVFFCSKNALVDVCLRYTTPNSWGTDANGREPREKLKKV